jgi:hypothetical protein
MDNTINYGKTGMRWLDFTRICTSDFENDLTFWLSLKYFEKIES